MANTKQIITLILVLVLSACDSDESTINKSNSSKKVTKSKAKKECQSNSDYLIQGAIGKFVFREARKVLPKEKIKFFQRKKGEINSGYGRDGTNSKETCRLLVSLYKEMDAEMQNSPKSKTAPSPIVKCLSTQDMKKNKQNSERTIRLSLMAMSADNQSQNFMQQQNEIISDYDAKKITPQQACKKFHELSDKVTKTVLATRK